MPNALEQTVSPDCKKLLRDCRESIKGEAARLGKELAKRLSKTFYKMESNAPFQGARKIVLIEGLLYQACVSFWLDILRVKAFHHIDVADGHKKAGYIVKWIPRCQPVKPLVTYDGELTQTELTANSLFALLCASRYLNLNTLLINELKHVRYMMEYRDIAPEAWAMIFYLLEQCYSQTSCD